MSAKDIILFDLDGTLADCSHRLHHIEKSPKDWPAFFAACDGDAPIVHMIHLFQRLSRNADGHDDLSLWITSGRSDECREATEAWLHRHGVKYERLVMRKAGDFTGDDTLKSSWLEDGTIPKERVLMAFDDRDRVVASWRAAGIPCLQVAPGAF